MSDRVSAGLSMNNSASLRGNKGEGVGGSKSGSGITGGAALIGVGAGAEGIRGEGTD